MPTCPLPAAPPALSWLAASSACVCPSAHTGGSGTGWCRPLGSPRQSVPCSCPRCLPLPSPQPLSLPLLCAALGGGGVRGGRPPLTQGLHRAGGRASFPGGVGFGVCEAAGLGDRLNVGLAQRAPHAASPRHIHKCACEQSRGHRFVLKTSRVRREDGEVGAQGREDMSLWPWPPLTQLQVPRLLKWLHAVGQRPKSGSRLPCLLLGGPCPTGSTCPALRPSTWHSVPVQVLVLSV